MTQVTLVSHTCFFLFLFSFRCTEFRRMVTLKRFTGSRITEASHSFKQQSPLHNQEVLWSIQKLENLGNRSAKPLHIILCLQYLGETKSSKAAVEEAVNGLAWAHSLAGIDSPTANPLVRSTLEEMIQVIVQDCEQDDSLANWPPSVFLPLLASFASMNYRISDHVTCNLKRATLS